MNNSSQKMFQKITRGMQAHYPITYIVGWDETRIEAILSRIASKQEQIPLISWTIANGFSDTGNDSEPLAAIRRIRTSETSAIYLLKDFPACFAEDQIIIRSIRDLYGSLRKKNIYVFFSYPLLILPEVLNKEVYVVEMSLPIEAEIENHLQSHLDSRGLSGNYPADFIHQITVAMIGLSFNEINHLLIRLFRNSTIDLDQALIEVHEAKSQMLKKESCLNFIPAIHSLEQVGGLENLKDWVLKRKDLFTEEAFKSGVPLPSGILFMGISGCGKSLAAKAIAATWKVPLVRLDMSMVLSGAYGAPESAFDHALRIAEEIAPVVLWIDELENSFGYDPAQPGKGNINIFSSFLSWMQDKPSTVFLAATANRIQQLPAELMRKGRFDQLFFLDLPTKIERMHIFKIHLSLQGQNPEEYDLSYLAAATKEWSGAEIEQAVKSARIDAYQEKRDFAERDILFHTSNMVPLSQTMKEQIQSIREWSRNRAIPASRRDANNE